MYKLHNAQDLHNVQGCCLSGPLALIKNYEYCRKTKICCLSNLCCQRTDRNKDFRNIAVQSNLVPLCLQPSVQYLRGVKFSKFAVRWFAPRMSNTRSMRQTSV